MSLAKGDIDNPLSLGTLDSTYLRLDTTNDPLTNPLDIQDETALTNAVQRLLSLSHNTTSTPTSGFGSGIDLQAETTTTQNQTQALIESSWSTATHATRTSDLDMTILSSGSSVNLMKLDGSQKAAVINQDGVTFPSTDADVALQVGSTTDTEISLIGGTTSTVSLNLGDTADEDMGMVSYNNDTDTLSLYASGSSRISFSSTAITPVVSFVRAVSLNDNFADITLSSNGSKGIDFNVNMADTVSITAIEIDEQEGSGNNADVTFKGLAIDLDFDQGKPGDSLEYGVFITDGNTDVSDPTLKRYGVYLDVDAPFTGTNERWGIYDLSTTSHFNAFNRFGTTGAGSHSLGQSDSLFGADIEVDGTAYFDGNINMAGGTYTIVGNEVDQDTLFIKNEADVDLWLKLVGGSESVQTARRAYLAFGDITEAEGTNRYDWLMGRNAVNWFILYDRDLAGVHRIRMKNFGETQLCSAGSDAVTINSAEDPNTGTGGLTVESGGSSPTDWFRVNSTDGVFGLLPLDIQNTTDGASNQVAQFKSGNRATPADGDEGYISFLNDNSSGTLTEFSRLSFVAQDVGIEASQDGELILSVLSANSMTDMLRIQGLNQRIEVNPEGVTLPTLDTDTNMVIASTDDVALSLICGNSNFSIIYFGDAAAENRGRILYNDAGASMAISIQGSTRMNVGTSSVSFNNAVDFSSTAGITASTTQSQGQQALTTTVNQVSTVANAGDVVTLPSAASGGRMVFIANDGANSMDVYPATGDNIDGAGVNTAVAQVSGADAIYFSLDNTNWRKIQV